MPTSGEQTRPPRVLVAAGRRDVDVLRRVLRAEGYIVEVLLDDEAVAARLQREPPVDIVAIDDGLAVLARARVLAAARERDVWCLYLESKDASAPLRADERAALVAAVPMDAGDAQIRRALRTVIAARRSRSVEA